MANDQDQQQRGAKAFERLVKGDDQTVSHSTCRKCGGMGHLTFECKNDLKLKPHTSSARKDPFADEKAKLRARIAELEDRAHSRAKRREDEERRRSRQSRRRRSSYSDSASSGSESSGGSDDSGSESSDYSRRRRRHGSHRRRQHHRHSRSRSPSGSSSSGSSSDSDSRSRSPISPRRKD